MPVFVLSLLLASGAWARGGRQLTDVMWLPEAGVIYGETALILEGSQVNVNKTDDIDVMKQNFQQRLGIGVTDLLSVGVVFDQQLKGETSSPDAAGRTYIDQEGLKNPKLEATWRLLDLAPGLYGLDLKASYTPDLLESRAKNNDQDFTAAEGGAVYFLGARLGEKSSESQWSLDLNLSYYAESKTEYTNSDDVKVDPAHVLDSSYCWQANMLPGLLDFRSRLGLRYSSATESSNGTEVDAIWRGLVDTSLLWTLMNNQLMLTTGVSLFLEKDYEVTSAGSTSEYQNSKGYVGYVSLLYQF